MKHKLFILFLIAAVFLFCKAAVAQEVVKNKISYNAFPMYSIEFSDFKNFYMGISSNPDDDGVAYKGTYTLDVQDKVTFVNVNLNNGKKEKFLPQKKSELPKPG